MGHDGLVIVIYRALLAGLKPGPITAWLITCLYQRGRFSQRQKMTKTLLFAKPVQQGFQKEDRRLEA